ncbi:KCNH5 [Cordylochernes scorpioides]|uniref:KCNH5 n=1 Tax=Cordylochernes scorpioides TaxID=51811 RepID=A0ABY6L2M1_9ARAC|nr:KCNH5 [Cordylochernes scorpioides]
MDKFLDQLRYPKQEPHHKPKSDCSFLLANAQIVDFPIVYCSESFCKISGYGRAEVMQKSCRCTFMHGEMTDPATVDKLDRALDNHYVDQAEILLYKKNSKSLHFEDAELQALLDEDSTQMQEKLAKQLQVSQAILRAKSRGACPANFQNRRLGPIASEKKAMLCVWWDQTGVVYLELLKPGEMVNTSRYEQQMHSLREALNEKRPEWREKHNKLILQHDNAPAHNATVVKNTIKDLGWELLPHPPYSPDLAPSNYHLFTSLGHALKKQEFSNSDIL